MAVVFTVEDGTLVDGANSYVSLAEANDINSIDPRSTWGTLDDPTKQQLLMFATRWIDERCYFFGHKVKRDQALRWPRWGVRDRENLLYLHTVVPAPIRQLAARLGATFNESRPEDMEQAAGVRRFRTDLVEVEWQQGYLQNSAPGYVGSLLAGIGYGPNDHGARRIRRV